MVGYSVYVKTGTTIAVRDRQEMKLENLNLLLIQLIRFVQHPACHCPVHQKPLVLYLVADHSFC